MSNKIQLYSLATPNGQKVSIALEEMSLEYDAHTIDITAGDQFKPYFLKINPNSKIPAIVDPVGDGGRPLSIMESGAILVYLAEKTGKFLSKDVGARSKALQWLFFQVGGVGPMFGQFGHFYKYGKSKCDHPYPVERYSKETTRLLGIVENQLKKNEFLAGSKISIADFSVAPWIAALDTFYEAGDLLSLHCFERTQSWLQEILSRPSVARGMNVCSI